MNFFLKYRKTMLITSSILFGLFLVHVIFVYIYSNGKYVGVPGGSITVGMVADSSSIKPLEPLSYGGNKINDLIYNLLFRGLIRYNSETEIYEGDLANCDVSHLKKISCTLREDAVWSDGSKITSEDIIASMNIFTKNTNHKNIQNILKNTKISTEENVIIIENPHGSADIMEVLSYPILRSDVVDQIKNGRLKKESYITSGPFIFDEETSNSEYNFHNFSFKTNPNYKKTVWVEKFNIRIFPDVSSLEKGADYYHVAIPPANKENLKLNPRFRAINYGAYEFFGIFFQTNSLDKNIRNILHKYLAHKISDNTITTNGQISVDSIFQTGAKIHGKNELSMNFEVFMNEKGYKRKGTLITEANNIETTLTSGGTVPKTKYFSNGGGNSILFSNDPKEEIVLHGKIPSNVNSVTINGYTLKEYTPGSKTFVYRISKTLGNLQTGKNIYNLDLTTNTNAHLKDTLTIYHTLNNEEMQAYKNNVEGELLKRINTPEKIAEREIKKQERIKAIESLSDAFYYNDKLESFDLKIAFLSNNEASVNYMNVIENALQHIGIQVNPIALTAKELDEMIKKNKKDYDLILIGVQSPGSIGHLGTSFFSSENGNANFSGLNNKNFVALFESLKNVADSQKSKEIQEEIVKSMNDLGIFLPLSRPEHFIYIDRNIKGFSAPKIISNLPSFAYFLDTLSSKNKYEISLEGKGISNFFSWIVNQ